MKNLSKIGFVLGLIACAYALVSFITGNSETMINELMLTAGIIPIVIPEFAEKSKEETDAMNADDFGAYLQNKKRFETATLKSEIQGQIADALKESADSDVLKGLEGKMNDLIEENNHTMLKLKEVTEGQKTEKPVGLKALIAKNIDSLKKMVSDGAGKVTLDIEMKTGANQIPADITNRTDFAQMLNGVGQIPHRKTYLKERIRVVPTNKEYVKYVDQTSVIRDAKNVAQCSPSTHTSKVTWETFDLQTKKVRDYINVCIDMLEDYDFISAEISNLVSTDVALKVDNGLLLDDGTGANLNGIASYASTFNASNVLANYALKVPTPQLIDLIVVAGAQIMAFGEENFFMADTVYLNPVDYTLMKLLKDTDENYIGKASVDARLFQDMNGRLWIDGNILVIPNPSVPANEFYIFDSMKATIYQRKTSVVEFSYENRENFETETVTVKAYERVNMLVKNSQANAFMHVPSISAGIIAITKP